MLKRSSNLKNNERGDTMKRMDKIYQYIQERSKSYSSEEIQGRIGVEAAEISQALQIMRSNVSRELNNLYRDGKILKFSGRPVLYFDRGIFEQIKGVTLPSEIEELANVESGVTSAKQLTIQKSGFDCLIGSDGSLKKQIEQAKAAI